MWDDERCVSCTWANNKKISYCITINKCIHSIKSLCTQYVILRKCYLFLSCKACNFLMLSNVSIRSFLLLTCGEIWEKREKKIVTCLHDTLTKMHCIEITMILQLLIATHNVCVWTLIVSKWCTSFFLEILDCLERIKLALLPYGMEMHGRNIVQLNEMRILCIGILLMRSLWDVNQLEKLATTRDLLIFLEYDGIPN